LHGSGIAAEVSCELKTYEYEANAGISLDKLAKSCIIVYALSKRDLAPRGRSLTILQDASASETRAGRLARSDRPMSIRDIGVWSLEGARQHLNN